MNGEKALIGSLCKKHSISLVGYPLSSHFRGDELHVQFFMSLLGDDEKIKNKFYKDLKKHERILNIERRGQYIIGLIKETPEISQMYRYDFIHLDPVFIKEDGTETWSLAGWKKKDLLDFIDMIEKRYGAELIKIKEEKIPQVSVMKSYPILSKKQTLAMELAIKEGYYCYPRKTCLEKLAKMMGISYSTFQAHLRKAEKSIIPFSFGSR